MMTTYALSYLSKLSDKRLIYVEERSIFNIVSIIAACDIFIGTSMHGNITAFPFGIPHLVAPIGADKIDGFLEIVGLDLNSKLESYDDLILKVQKLDTFDGHYILRKSNEAKRKV